MLVLSASLYAYETGAAPSGSSSTSKALDAATAYGGQAYGVATQDPFLGGATYSDTGTLPSSGGVLFGDFAQVSDSAASASVFLTYTRGFMDEGRSEVATSDVTLFSGTPFEIDSSFLYSGVDATCSGVSGTSEIPDLSVGGLSVPVTDAPNQVYAIPGVLTLVINEQIDQSSIGTYDLTVNALHATLANGVDVVVSSARSAVTCGGGVLGLSSGVMSTLSAGSGMVPMWIPPHDFMTGGGFFFAQDGQATCNGVPFSGDRINFGFNAGPRPGTWPDVKGHLNLIDHGPNCPHHVEGTDVTDYFPYPPDDTQHCRRWAGDATVDHTPGFHYAVVTCDYGEPGRNDRFAINVWTSTDENTAPIYHADNFDGTPSPEGGNLPGGNIQLHVFG